MLHHQHPVPIPASQLREAGRMAQVPIRMPQPGIAPPQQRPPHGTLMMGMQPPQASVPGVMVSMPASVMASPLPPQPPSTVSIAPDVAHAVDGVVHHHHHPQRHQHQQHQHHHQHPHQHHPHHQYQQPPQQMNAQQQSDVANTKEKTPMCLINELARFNKIQHQYRLTNEMGPAHKKRFTVTLKLGEEEYSAEGPSIKKAQHAAAAEALQKTAYKHPPPKTQRNIRLGKINSRCLLTGNITPTVELNALAMKRGEPTVYTFMDPPHPNPYLTPNFNFRGMYNQRYHYGKQPGYAPMFFVSLRVGMREFFGEGPTAQAARHDAASKALHELKILPVSEENIQSIQENDFSCCVVGSAELDPNADLKSPISLVHEIALKRNLHVNFEVISEKGPPHMRTFVTRCTVGDKVTEGEGNGKKVSKKRAAEKMLDELKKLPPASPTTIIARIKRKPSSAKKKTRNLIKVYEEQKAKPDYGEDINPISRLIQIQQAKKEREPVYTLLEERGVPRRREFVMEVTVGQHSCTGTGPNKKLAKRAAAEGLLQLLGYSRPSTQPGKPSIKNPGDSIQDGDKNRKVTFLEEPSDKGSEGLSSIGGTGGSGGRQLVPGLLLMADTSAAQSYNQQAPSKGAGLSLSLGVSPSNLANLKTTATIAKELLKGGTSPTAEALVKSGQIQKMSAPSVSSQVPGQVVRPKDQLLYLAQLLNFKVQFTDFPKRNHNEFLSLVSLSTDPPQMCHGAGTTTDSSHDQAALTALRALSELGLDSVAPSGGSLKKDPSTLAGGDGHHLTSGQKATISASTITTNGAVGN